jgi:farnesyl-diphosphate farnesyltransferase
VAFQRAHSYRKVIQDCCQKMGNGMAYYAKEAEKPDSLYAVDTLADLDLYCHYVAGIIGEGVSRLWSASGKEAADLGQRLSLANHMGLHLQKTNVMRDFREDLDDGRLFWPREIWSRYVSHPAELAAPGNEDKGRAALIDMAWDAMQHAPAALDYLSLLKNQSVFNFCAIPQVMAIATLDECFGNLDVLHRNVKIRKGIAVDVRATESICSEFDRQSGAHSSSPAPRTLAMSR